MYYSSKDSAQLINKATSFAKLFHFWIITPAFTDTPTLAQQTTPRFFYKTVVRLCPRWVFNIHSARMALGMDPTKAFISYDKTLCIYFRRYTLSNHSYYIINMGSFLTGSYTLAFAHGL